MATGLLVVGNWSVAGRYATGNTGKIFESTTIQGKKKYVELKLSLASGLYPAGGVPLPVAGTVGMKRNLDGYILHHPTSASTGDLTATGTNFIWTLNTSGNTLHAYRSVIVSGANASSFKRVSGSTGIPTQVFYVTAIGW